MASPIFDLLDLVEARLRDELDVEVYDAAPERYVLPYIALFEEDDEQQRISNNRLAHVVRFHMEVVGDPFDPLAVPVRQLMKDAARALESHTWDMWDLDEVVHDHFVETATRALVTGSQGEDLYRGEIVYTFVIT